MWELPVDVTGVSEDTGEAFLVSGNQNININNGSSSYITATDDSNSNLTTTEQASSFLLEGHDLPTAVEPAESEPTNKELVIGTWNLQSGVSTHLDWV